MHRTAPRASSIVRSLVLVASSFGASCASTSTAGRHFDVDTWSQGLAVTTSHPSRWVPPAVLALGTPIAWLSDGDVTEDSISNHVFNSNTKYGDEIAAGFAVVPLALGAFDEFRDDGRFLEVSAEALSLTMAATYALKYTINRQRPNGTSEDSFPSGHTSMAFAGATLLQRTIEDRAGQGWGNAAYALYVPASYVSISRLEGGRHFLADVVFGAALGLATAHWVYDAHYGDSDHPGLFEPRSRVHTSVGPVMTPDGIGLGLQISF